VGNGDMWESGVIDWLSDCFEAPAGHVPYGPANKTNRSTPAVPPARGLPTVALPKPLCYPKSTWGG
jgi:hypothetical protein